MISNRNYFSWAWLVLCIWTLAGCGDSAEQVGRLTQGVSIPNTGFVPYPILVDADLDAPEPILAPDGSVQAAWDGSHAELMAADAYVDCAWSSSMKRFGGHDFLPGLPTVEPAFDGYLQNLVSKMDDFECLLADPEEFDFFHEQWRRNRTSPLCNVDPQSGQPAKIEIEERAPNQYATFHQDPPEETWGIIVSDFDEEIAFEDARFLGGLELEYADLNLCMAQRLRSQLNGGQSLFTPASDHAEIVAVIRERAQLATMYYGLLAKVLSSTGPIPTSLSGSGNDFLILIRRWAEQVGPSVLESIGEDFATAVRLDLEATYELAELLERQAATRPVGEAGFGRADRDWGLGQPRLRLMNLLYGGDPIGTPAPPFLPGRSRGGVGRSGLPTFVSAEMRDPRIQTLLGLARTSDALLMKVLQGQFGPAGFDVPPSAERMYRTIEVTLRSQACERETPANPDCDPETIEPLLPDISEFEDYLLWQEHRVEPTQATTLAQAFAQAFGQLVQAPSTLPGSSTSYRQTDGMLHLFGSHQFLTLEGSSWVHIDPEFSTGPFAGYELMADFAELGFLPKTILVAANANEQGFVLNGSADEWNQMRNLGAVSALAFVREALVEGSEAPVFAEPFFNAGSVALQEIENAVGPRSVIVRPKRTTVSGPCPFGSPPPTCISFAQATDEFPINEVDVITHPGDPFDTLTVADQSRQLHTVAVDPDSVGLGGFDRADLDAAPTFSGTFHTYSGAATGYERRSFEYESDDDFVRTVLLRGDDPNGMAGTQIYLSLFAHALRSNQGFPDEAFATSFGGRLNQIGERAMSRLSYDWSRPAFDAFGLPVDWVPPADASLVGGAPGEPSYQYYLRSAKEAAQEATAAVQTAIDKLVEETLQTVDLEAAEERARTISEIEKRALCGPSPTCEIAVTEYRPFIKNCTPDAAGVAVAGSALFHCNKANAQLRAQVPLFGIAEPLITASKTVAPTFPEFEGSETQRVLIRQWSAKRNLEAAVNSSMDLAIATGREIAASEEALVAATAEREAANGEIDARIAELDDQDLEIQALISEMEDAAAEIDLVRLQAETAWTFACSPTAFDEALDAGRSYTSSGGAIHVGADGIPGSRDGIDANSWSPGPLYAQYDRCVQAAMEFYRADTLAEPAKATLQEKIDALIARSETLNNEQKTALSLRRSAAEATYSAALSAASAAQQGAWAQFSSQLTQIQQATGELNAAVAELSQTQLRTENSIAAANLERDVVEKQAATRFGLQRKFRSYDMWRARALLESARRLAVAARRAIEARFVVDLSELDAPQAFVASPAIWADEVYAADLNAPSVVGLSVAPQIEGAVFPNQLIDYVENLERFVQGYTVSYPTSVASPDTEVIVIAGPELVQEVTRPIVNELDELIGEEIVNVLSGDSLGWSFFCPDTSGWFPHPGTGQVPLVDRLSEMCSGSMPTRARYSFSFDPWARLNRGIRSMPLEQRHNVRWGRLAVNLIGTGIRDCQTAGNPTACFSESFLRFQLQHSGPAWATNHAHQWRAFDLPTAFVEGGKALASEEWLDPIANSWTAPYVASVARGELFGRPVGGGYELIIELGPEVRLERMEQVQLLVETEYWVRQQ